MEEFKIYASEREEKKPLTRVMITWVVGQTISM